MAESTTITVRVSLETKEKLQRLASGTRRSRSFLAGEAVAAYVDHELEIIQGIQRGIADVEADRTISHEEAMNEIDALIDVIEAKRT